MGSEMCIRDRSKGLQAPIVILADATDDPRPRRVSFGVSMAAWDKLPVFPLGKDERHGAIADAHDEKERAEREEHWRLLYVAMTRAKEQLQLIVPQRFYVHQQAAFGDRHVYASRSRFIPNKVAQFFESTEWPSPDNAEAAAKHGPGAGSVDLAPKVRSERGAGSCSPSARDRSRAGSAGSRCRRASAAARSPPR